MIVGIMSDSHGRVAMVHKALALFDAHGVERIIHCGDVGGVEVFDAFVGRAFDFVCGNCDEWDVGVFAYLRTVGLHAPAEVPLRLTIAGKRIAVFHGHEPQAGEMESAGDVDYVLHGHTHVRRDERFGGVRIINPGALHRADPRTVAILDTDHDALTFHEIPRG